MLCCAVAPNWQQTSVQVHGLNTLRVELTVVGMSLGGGIHAGRQGARKTVLSDHTALHCCLRRSVCGRQFNQCVVRKPDCSEQAPKRS